MKLYNSTAKAVARRKSALSRLEEQLRTGHKPEKMERNGKSIISEMKTVLSEQDIKRINKEINIIKSRI